IEKMLMHAHQARIVVCPCRSNTFAPAGMCALLLGATEAIFPWLTTTVWSIAGAAPVPSMISTCVRAITGSETEIYDARGFGVCTWAKRNVGGIKKQIINARDRCMTITMRESKSRSQAKGSTFACDVNHTVPGNDDAAVREL